MTLTYEWEIRGMTKAPSLDGLSDVIIGVDFKYTGTDSDSGHNSEYYSHTQLDAPDSENFTALADLTESQVAGWVQAAVANEIPMFQTLITNNINEKITPTRVTVKQLPWAPAADEGEA